MSVWSLERFLPPVYQDNHHHEQEGGQGDRDGDHLYAGLPAAALLDNAPHLRRYIQALLELVGKLALGCLAMLVRIDSLIAWKPPILMP